MMRGVKLYSCVLLNALFCLLVVQLLLSDRTEVGVLVQEKGRNQRSEQHLSAGLSHYEKLSKRPLLVRFNWYSRKKTPIHVGYGGRTAMAILEPYGFKETSSDDWDLLWTMVPQWDYFHKADTPNLPRPWQIHNHCLPLTNNRGISGEKVSQWQLFKCMRDKYGAKEFSYMPESLILPDELPVLEKILKTNSSPWIIKLSTGKRAIGIQLATNSRNLPRDRNKYIAQHYISNPLILHGRKFHIRLYLVITNLQPLSALVHREGLVLFAASNYTNDPESLNNFNIHMTNAAIADRNKKQSVTNSMLLSELWKHLEEVYHVTTDSIWDKIVDAMAKIVLSEECDRPLDIRTPRTCFDVIGVDVLLDSHFKPFVLECNNGPELYTLIKQVEIRQANDKAHRAMLRDLIPLVAMHSQATKQDLESFHKKLKSHFVIKCGENAGFGGNCWTQNEIDNLWRLHYEDQHLQNFQRVLPSIKHNQFRRLKNNNY